MARRTYTEEFKIEAVKQVTDDVYKIADTAHKLGIHLDSLRSRSKNCELKYTLLGLCEKVIFSRIK